MSSVDDVISLGARRAMRPDGRQALLPSAVLGMAVFLGTEIMLFAGLVSAFLVLRVGATPWPPPGQPRLPVVVTGFNTAALLASGVALAWAARAGRRRGASAARRGLSVAVLLGAAFVAAQGTEWARLLHFGLTTRSSLYGASFYTIVGTHGVHALAGLAVLAAAWRRAGLLGPGARWDAWLTAAAMFWWFVAGVWPVLYAVVYFS